MNDGSYKPFRKPNNETLYIHKKSNHPPNIIKQIPLSIEKRLSSISSSKDIFDEAAQHYQESLAKCGYEHKLQYNNTNANETNERRKRRRNVIWFNPPYSKNVTNNVGKYFFNLISKYFPATNKLSKIFNKNTLKISYCCMPNIKSITNAHNRKITTPTVTKVSEKTCNCLRKNECPIEGKCLSTNSLYEGTLTSTLPDYKPRTYAGISEPIFKSRHNMHNTSFKLRRYEKSTKLAREVWRIKDKRGQFNVK